MSICRILSLAAVTAGLILSSMASGNAQAAGIHWEYDLQNAATQSGRTGRPMLLKFTASWCGYCRKMKKETFNDPRIVEHVTECFIPVEVDADRNQKLVQAIGIRGLPTTVIVSPDLKVVRKLTGYQTADQLDQHLAQICPATHHRQAVLRNFRGNSSLATYLTVVARRVVVREMTRRRMAEALGHVGLQNESLSSTGSSGSAAQAVDDREELERLLQELPETECQVMRLYHLEGHSYREISSELGIPENTIGSVLSRAREKLKQINVGSSTGS